MAFDRDKNPLFQHMQAELFLCLRGEEVVGRISAQIDSEHLRIHQDAAGFYGNFDAVDDPEVAKMLFAAAHGWLASRGMKVMRGPYTMNINEEAGLQIDGFEHTPMFLTSYNPPYYRALVEGAGFTKVKELYSWRYRNNFTVPELARKVAERARRNSKVVVRPMNMSNFENELRAGLEVFNAAWKNNWGFVPLTEAEMKKAAEDLKMIMDPRIVLVAEYEGVPVGMALVFPNVNQAIRPLHGKLFPFGWARLIWNTKVRRPKNCRLTLLGIKPDFQGLRSGGGLSILLCLEVFERCSAAGYEWAELSWTLDDNDPINHVIKAMGGELYKTHYVYERPLTEPASK